MEINVSVQYNGGLLPDIMLSTQCNYIKYLGTVKASTRMILVHVVQKMYNIFRLLLYSITEGSSPILCCRPDVIT